MIANRTSRVTLNLTLDRGHPDRLFRAALLSTWRQLRLSVRMGRPITLQNLVRLFRRKASVIADRMPRAEYSRRVDEWRPLLVDAYRQRQTFGRTPQSCRTCIASLGF
jgi:hypothetical protein